MNGYKFYLLAVPTDVQSEGTSEKIRSRSSQKYAENWDSIFSKKSAEKQESSLN